MHLFFEWVQWCYINNAAGLAKDLIIKKLIVFVWFVFHCFFNEILAAVQPRLYSDGGVIYWPITAC